MSEERQEQSKRSGKPLWKSKVVIGAGLMTVIGLVMWVYAMATAPKAQAQPAGSGVDSSLVSGYAGPGGETVTAAKEQASRLVDQASPAVLRFGLSFLVGCVLAYLFKKFIKLSLLIAALVAGGIFALHKTGIVSFDADAVKSGVDRSFAWAKGEASGFKDLVFGYLPSSASACAGLAYGAWKA